MLQFDVKAIRTDEPVTLEEAQKNVLRILCNLPEPFTIGDINGAMDKFLEGKFFNNQYIGVYLGDCFHLKILYWLRENGYLRMNKCWYTRDENKIRQLLGINEDSEDLLSGV